MAGGRHHLRAGVAALLSQSHEGIMTLAVMCLLAYLYAGWLLFVLVMGFYRAHLSKRLHGVTKALALPVVLFAVVLDALSNLLIAPLIFGELPKEWLVTDRLKRMKREDHGWRGAIADLICEHLLDVFDPTGDHC